MTPKGFWSYSRSDDKHLGGALTELRQRLAGEISMLLGCDVGIFQDIADIHAGERWAERLREEVTAAAFMIPILTPSYFASEWCRDEAYTFLEIARDKGAGPMIFPIRFAEYDTDRAGLLHKELRQFQYADFSAWRFEVARPLREKLEHEFASQVVQSLRSVVDVPEEGRTARPGAFDVLTVDQLDRGDFTTIGEAIEAARSGSRIVVAEGTYREHLHLPKPLEIVGEGDRELIVVQSDGERALTSDATRARIAGITFRGNGEVGVFDGLAFTGGAIELEDCIVENCSGVTVRGRGSSLQLVNCILENTTVWGVLAAEGARAVAEDCTFSAGDRAVAARNEGTHVVLKRCVILGARKGLNLDDGAEGHVEECTFSSAATGVSASGEGTRVELYRSVVGSAMEGISFSEGAGGQVENCEIRDYRMSGLVIRDECDPLVRNCTLSGGFCGAEVRGRGRLENCTIERNRVGIQVSSGGSPVVTGCTIAHNTYGMDRSEEKGGTFEDNDLHDNDWDERDDWNRALNSMSDRIRAQKEMIWPDFLKDSSEED